MATIALITDFGTKDWFVGSMKAVINRINPHASMVDITHHVAPGDIHAGAFVLNNCFHFFPKSTVFVAVIDPGVGSQRQGIVVHTKDYFFVGPDNGIFSRIIQTCDNHRVYRIENPLYCNTPISTTFHGRDIFAPVGAHLSQGIAPTDFGQRLHTWVTISWPKPTVIQNKICGEIVYIDHFGNAITTIDSSYFNYQKKQTYTVLIKGKEPIPFCFYYHQVEEKMPLALINSSNLLEIAVRDGNAAQQLDLHKGLAVEVTISSDCD